MAKKINNIMDAKELRVGNYYHQEEKRIIERDCPTGNIYKTTNYVEKDICLSISDLCLQISNTFNKPDLSPIILTEELLIAFGAIIINYKDIHKDVKLAGLDFELNNEGLFYTGGEGVRLSINIKYVHKMQNLVYELGGKELTL